MPQIFPVKGWVGWVSTYIMICTSSTSILSCMCVGGWVGGGREREKKKKKKKI